MHILIKIIECIVKMKIIMHPVQMIIPDGSILGSLLLEHISRSKRKRPLQTDNMLFDYTQCSILVKTCGKIEILIGKFNMSQLSFLPNFNYKFQEEWLRIPMWDYFNCVGECCGNSQTMWNITWQTDGRGDIK